VAAPRNRPHARRGGVGAAARLSIHQSTCSQLVDKLEARGLISKARKADDQRRVGLQLTDQAAEVLATAPGPVAGILPQALQGLPTTRWSGCTWGWPR
jgi:DNA-binding MarR family transcriptional regulator